MQTSIVIPVFNGERTIRPLVGRLLDELGIDAVRIVLVNDGSRDDSDEVCRSLWEEYPGAITYLQLSKNFGEHGAVMAGLHHAVGDYVVIMDDDFQNPPEEVPRLVGHAAEHGLDVVYTRYRRKRHSWSRNLGSRLNDRMATVLLDKPPDLYLSSFKCLSAFAVGEVIKYTGPYPYIDGLVLRSTRKIGTLEVRHDPRREGRSNYTLGKLAGVWASMAVNSSILPARLGIVLGLACGAAGLALGVLTVAWALLRPGLQVGWAAAIVVALSVAGVQLVTLGIVGEYVGRLLLTNNGTPQFVVREALRAEHEPCARSRISAASPASPS